MHMQVYNIIEECSWLNNYMCIHYIIYHGILQHYFIELTGDITFLV